MDEEPRSAYRRSGANLDALLLISVDRNAPVVWMDETAAVFWSRDQAAAVLLDGRRRGTPWKRVSADLINQARSLVADSDPDQDDDFPVFDGRVDPEVA